MLSLGLVTFNSSFYTHSKNVKRTVPATGLLCANSGHSYWAVSSSFSGGFDAFVCVCVCLCMCMCECVHVNDQKCQLIMPVELTLV